MNTRVIKPTNAGETNLQIKGKWYEQKSSFALNAVDKPALIIAKEDSFLIKEV